MRVLVACVAESNAHFAARVETLLLSMRRLGGQLADAPVVVNVVGQADAEFTERVEKLGGRIRSVSRFLDDPRRIAGPSNKLRMLELAREEQFDVLLAVDCDVAFAGDPTGQIPRDVVAAAPPDIDPLTEAEWQRLFAALELEPGGRVLEATMGARVPEYFNSGVVCVPAEQCEELLARWALAVDELLALYRDRPDSVPEGRRYFLDQFALMKALRTGIPHRPLSSALNFPTHVRVSSPAALASEPAILHYHGELDEHGFLLAPRSQIARPAAERVNVERARALGLPYSGLGTRPARERLVRRREEWRTAVAAASWYESPPVRGARGAARWIRATSSRSRAR
jgi:hypothetical protein